MVTADSEEYSLPRGARQKEGLETWRDRSRDYRRQGMGEKLGSKSRIQKKTNRERDAMTVVAM